MIAIRDSLKPWMEQEFEVVPDQAYTSGPDADAQQKLDFYLPKGKTAYPVLVFLHGDFHQGDRKEVATLGETFARLGMSVTAVGYRLAPQSKHPAQVQDAAKAFAWVQKNIPRHGGKADQLFVGGHSAGALVASLLASDEQFLKAEGASLKDIKGVISLSGGYRILEGSLALAAMVKVAGLTMDPSFDCIWPGP